MIDDFKPPKRPVRSMTEALNRRQATTPSQAEISPIVIKPDFQTPEQVAAQDSTSPEVPVTDESPVDQPAPMPKKTTKNKRWFSLSWPPGNKEFILAGVLLILLVGGGLAAWYYTQATPTSIKNTKFAKSHYTPPKPTTVASNLTGLQVSPGFNDLPVTGVMIENSVDARPQSGLGQAGVVFEAVAEGGVTRFLALFQDTSPANVGPIRSARPYYIQWDLGFDAPYAHVGGSPDGLSDITAWDVKDMNQFYNGNYYHRVSTREAPHNVYTAISTLNQLEAAKGWTSSNFTSWPRKADAPAKLPTAKTINMQLSGPVYDPQYVYDPSTNTYKRSEDGQPQIDANTNQQISPKVVVAIVVPESQGALDATGAYYSNYQTIGTGTAYVFQDGLVTTGTWTKASNNAQISFTGSNGNPVKFNAGQTWITAVTSTSAVSYTP